jgi:hypothetical protein
MAATLIYGGGHSAYARLCAELEATHALNGKGVASVQQYDEVIPLERHDSMGRTLSYREMRRVAIIYAPPDAPTLGIQAIRFTPSPETYEFDLSKE